MSSDFYDLKEPTKWALPPLAYSFSSIQALRSCPRRWQLVHSSWGQHSTFPERPQPAAIEGRIVHESLDLLARELGRCGRPPIGSPGFQDALERCGFWTFFAIQVDAWNRRLAVHPRTGPQYVLRTKPRELANQAICLFRDRYHAGRGEAPDLKSPGSFAPANDLGASLVSLLGSRRALSEVRLEHPQLPLFGVIDSVALEDDGSTTIVDFKTGAPKSEHREQVLFYALLWWRVTGIRPGKVVVQYLDIIWTASPGDADLASAEATTIKQIEQARDCLSQHPAAANPCEECAWCAVKPRCDEGWARGESSARNNVGFKSINLEVTVTSTPSPTGFLGTRANGDEVPVVFSTAVGCGLPQVNAGDRFRIVDAAMRSDGKEVTLLPWTEMYQL